MKPTLIYYQILRYQPQNMARLRDAINVSILQDPSKHSDDILAKADAILCPLGYSCDKIKIDRMPRVRALASNTTGQMRRDKLTRAARARY